ncbi:MAG: hypothetical protein R2839_07495 [Thermomicrobiales bacterium]
MAADANAIIATAVLVDLYALAIDAGDALAVTVATGIAANLPVVATPAAVAGGTVAARAAVRNRAACLGAGITLPIRTAIAVHVALVVATNPAIAAIISGRAAVAITVAETVAANPAVAADIRGRAAVAITVAETVAADAAVTVDARRARVGRGGRGWVDAVDTGADAKAPVARSSLIDGAAGSADTPFAVRVSGTTGFTTDLVLETTISVVADPTRLTTTRAIGSGRRAANLQRVSALRGSTLADSSRPHQRPGATEQRLEHAAPGRALGHRPCQGVKTLAFHPFLLRNN